MISSPIVHHFVCWLFETRCEWIFLYLFSRDEVTYLHVIKISNSLWILRQNEENSYQIQYVWKKSKILTMDVYNST